MPLLKWATDVLSRTTEEERDQMQALFDTAYWTKNANHQLSPDTEIVLKPIAAKSANSVEQPVSAHCQHGKWTAELKQSH